MPGFGEPRQELDHRPLLHGAEGGYAPWRAWEAGVGSKRRKQASEFGAGIGITTAGKEQEHERE